MRQSSILHSRRRLFQLAQPESNRELAIDKPIKRRISMSILLHGHHVNDERCPLSFDMDTPGRVPQIETIKPEAERPLRLLLLREVDPDELPVEWCEAYAKYQEAYAKYQEAYAKWREAYAKYQEAYAKWREDHGKWRGAHTNKQGN